MSVHQINELIISSNLSDADINSIIESIKYVRSRNARLNLATFRIGDRVQFTSSRGKRTIQGTVGKIAIKNVVVNTPQGSYRVPASMLQAA